MRRLTVLPSALGDAVSCTLDGAAASCTSPVALTGLGQGTHTYRVTESDLAGNTAAHLDQLDRRHDRPRS